MIVVINRSYQVGYKMATYGEVSDHHQQKSDTHAAKAHESRTLGTAHWAKSDAAHASGNRVKGAIHGALADRHFKKGNDHEMQSRHHKKQSMRAQGAGQEASEAAGN
jgi:hypothetical protein